MPFGKNIQPQKRVISNVLDACKGDKVSVEFGYHIVNPKIAKKLELKDVSLSKFIILKKEQFKI